MVTLKKTKTEQTTSKCWDCEKAFAGKCIFHDISLPWSVRVSVARVVEEKPLPGLRGKIAYKVLECDNFSLSSRAEVIRESKSVLKINKKKTKTKRRPKTKVCNDLKPKTKKRSVATMTENRHCIVCGEPSNGDCCNSPVCKIFYKSLRKKVVS